MKEVKKDVNTLTYLIKVKRIGIFGIILSIVLVGYDIYTFDGVLSIISLVIDGLLFAFSIYFIIKSNKLTEREVIAIEKLKSKEKGITKK